MTSPAQIVFLASMQCAAARVRSAVNACRLEEGPPRWRQNPARGQCESVDQNADCVIAVRRRFPHFGPKKIKAWLERDSPKVDWPAASTIGDILKREGLVEARRRRRRAIAQGEVVTHATAANEEWSIDFKGSFRTADGTRCDPLTLTDAASRYLVEVRIVEPTSAGVRGAMQRVFAEVGLPGAIRSDSGPPFGSAGAGGLSALSVWWLKLGIEPRYIPPSSPQDNGRHERMHRTLKAETSKPVAATAAEQRRRFDRFRRHYNEERPHEALEQTPPATHWRPSARTLPTRLEDPWYDADPARVQYSARCAESPPSARRPPIMPTRESTRQLRTTAQCDPAPCGRGGTLLSARRVALG
jgi:transposase InsO family protein